MIISYVITVPSEGGLYIILQGTVQEIQKNFETGEYTTTMVSRKVEYYNILIVGQLHIGKVFGEMKEPAYPPKLRLA